MALESFPPLALVSIRFICSGSLMLLVARALNARFPRGHELRVTCLSGVILLGGGNACLVFSETWIPSGLAALIISTSPFWMVGLEAAMPGGQRLHRPTVVGMLIGLAGAGLLVSADLTGSGIGFNVIRGFLVLQLGNFLWAYGSIYYLRQDTKTHPIVAGAVQQLAAGLALALPAVLIPEHPIHPTVRGVSALAYLVVFGSIVGYSAYIYALSHLPVAIVSIYPYVNPVVAVILGYLFYREPFGWREACAMLIIFGGVAIVKRYSPQHH